MCLLLCISANNREIFLKIYTFNSIRMSYKWRNFGCDRSIIKGTLHGELCKFASLYRLLPEGLPLNFVPRTLHTYNTSDAGLVAIGHQLKVLHLENKVPFRLYLGFNWRTFPHNSYFALPAHAQQNMKF